MTNEDLIDTLLGRTIKAVHAKYSSAAVTILLDTDRKIRFEADTEYNCGVLRVVVDGKRVIDED